MGDLRKPQVKLTFGRPVVIFLSHIALLFIVHAVFRLSLSDSESIATRLGAVTFLVYIGLIYTLLGLGVVKKLRRAKDKRKGDLR